MRKSRLYNIFNYIENGVLPGIRVGSNGNARMIKDQDSMSSYTDTVYCDLSELIDKQKHMHQKVN
jgi:hypothetical protein